MIFTPASIIFCFSFLKNQFRKADSNESGFLSLDEIKDLCHSLNIKLEKNKIVEIFNEANTNKTDKSSKERGQVLNEDEFVSFYYKLMRREEIDDLFTQYCPKDVRNIILKFKC